MDRDRLLWTLRTRGVSERVIAAAAAVPRDQFVPRRVRRHAWEDRPLSIGCGQTISQPSLVAYMLDVVGIETGDRVLDVGTGSGYQAALVSVLGAEVFSMERIAGLADGARDRLARLGFPVHVRTGDASAGWPECAPFDGVLVAAAAQSVPPALLDQLAAPSPSRRGGRLLLPLGDQGDSAAQRLVLFERTPDGVLRRDLIDVTFVPFVTGGT